MNGSRVVVVGGGAAGYFAAITCAEANPEARVTLYETTAHPLSKVRVSGGGRCNVTHACFDPRELVKRYPRGGRELRGAFTRWSPTETIAWFAARGVELKTEGDGRMFPITNDSETIVDCLQKAAEDAGVEIMLQCGVRKAEPVAGASTDGSSFWVTLTDDTEFRCEKLLIATGGNRSSAGLTVARHFGHEVEEPVPSLFTFHIDDPRLIGLSGISVSDVAVSVPGTKLKEGGPLLITHWGLSGPAILKLSAWGARELEAQNYEFVLRINFVPEHNAESLLAILNRQRTERPKKQLGNWNPFGLPARFWERQLSTYKIELATQWAGVAGAALKALANGLCAAEFRVVGKSMNKEEFVTCGGVLLREIDFKKMESKVCPGLFFAGEVLDIDGVTGGFNFQAAWTTGYLAGVAMATS